MAHHQLDELDEKILKLIIGNARMPFLEVARECNVSAAAIQIPEVVECHYTTGQYDLFIKIYAKNNQHLLSIIHNKLQPLGLARTESLISFKEAFKRQIPIDLDND